MKLYYAPHTCSLFPHIVAAEAGLALSLEKVDLQRSPRRTAGGEDYAAINPQGYVPALRLDDGGVLTEGTAIALHLAGLAPDSGLLPADGSVERMHLHQWLVYIASELHKSFSPWLFHPELGETAQKAAHERVVARLRRVEAQLQSQPYLAGDRFGLADAYLFVIASWSRPAGVDLTPFPRLSEYLARMGARPAVRAALRAHGMPADAAA